MEMVIIMNRLKMVDINVWIRVRNFLAYILWTILDGGVYYPLDAFMMKRRRSRK